MLLLYCKKLQHSKEEGIEKEASFPLSLPQYLICPSCGLYSTIGKHKHSEQCSLEMSECAKLLTGPQNKSVNTSLEALGKKRVICQSLVFTGSYMGMQLKNRVSDVTMYQEYDWDHHDKTQDSKWQFV